MQGPIRRFAENLETLRDFVDLVAPVLAARRLEQLKEDASRLIFLLPAFIEMFPGKFNFDEEKKAELLKALEGRVEVAPVPADEGESKEKGFQIKFLEDQEVPSFEAALIRMAKRQHQQALLYRSSLISLVSAVEWFLSELLHVYFDKFPDSVGGNDKSFSLADLKSFGSIGDAQSYLIDSRVEDILRGSLDDWLAFLKKQPKLSMGYMESERDRLVEIIQRRNLFVHNGGIVNRIYLTKVHEQVRAKVPIGRQLPIDKEYLEEAISLFEKLFVLVGAEFWKKLEPSEEERANVMMDLAFGHLVAERWDIAESLSIFTAGDSQLPERVRLTARVNYWIAKKAQGKLGEILEEVKKEDFSAKDEIFFCAQKAILDDEGGALEILSRLVQSKKLGSNELETWPLFRWIRESSGFAELLHSCKTLDGQAEEGSKENDNSIKVEAHEGAVEPLRFWDESYED